MLYRTYAKGCGFAQNLSDGVTNPIAPFSHTPAIQLFTHPAQRTIQHRIRQIHSIIP